MKKETMELLEWIKNALNTYVLASFTPAEAQKRREKYYKSLAFLESLPKIESRLRRGGFIQDKNGTPCCDGDQIINPSFLDNVKELGTLYWSKSDCRFYFKKDDKIHSLAVGSNGFEKVKK